jgi:hypothetical protein
MRTARLLFCAASSLSFVSVTGVAFECALFPQPPLDTISWVTTNPASLADVHRPCGGVGHDRSFGLQALSPARSACLPAISRQRDAVTRTPRPPGGCRHAPGAWFLSRRVGGPNLSIGLPTLGTVAMFER